MHKSSLFSRLISSFLIVALIPVVILAIYYASWGNRNLERNLEEQTRFIVEQDSIDLAGILEGYRHKAYLLSTSPLTIKVLRKDVAEAGKTENKEMYNLLFSTMKGDTYLASAHVVSDSGNVRLSTHDFPEQYDLRFHTNEWDSNSVVAQMEANQTASVIFLQGRTTSESGKAIIATILRRVYDEQGKNLGYVIVEVFSDAVASILDRDSTLTDEVLVDPSNYYAKSLINPSQVGGFDKFPYLSTAKNLNGGVYAHGDTIIAIAPLKDIPLSLAGAISSVPYTINMRQLLFVTLLTLGMGIIVSFVFASLFSRSISKPVKDLATSMKAVEGGNLHAYVADSSITEIYQLDHSFNAMVGQITSLMDLTREEEAKLAEAERKALESQMNPHFLFNTLNTIKALAKIHHEDEIYTISIKLGKLLRSTVDNHESECSIKESMELVNSYLTIQRIRFGEKLHVEESVQERTLRAMTPKLIIQPMVENAIVHGLEPKAGDWHLGITIGERDGFLTIVVKDDGIGFNRNELPENLDELDGSGHVGLYNTYRRLKLRYGDHAEFKMESEPKRGTTITMRMPAIYKQEDAES
ncbi:MAG: sensor histidine kinase [Sphaerochaetaceae bacterium]